jgi:hypothetical protein
MPKPGETDREEVWSRDDRRSEQGPQRAQPRNSPHRSRVDEWTVPAPGRNCLGEIAVFGSNLHRSEDQFGQWSSRPSPWPSETRPPPGQLGIARVACVGLDPVFGFTAKPRYRGPNHFGSQTKLGGNGAVRHGRTRLGRQGLVNASWPTRAWRWKPCSRILGTQTRHPKVPSAGAVEVP